MFRKALEAANATPPQRDRYVDFLRALSILVVVCGHWLMTVVIYKGGRFYGRNALYEIDGIWILTWVLQVMPLFFFVGGFSNLVTLRSVREKGGGFTEFVSGRTRRLMKPTSVFLAFWVPAAIIWDVLTPVEDRVIRSATGILARPIWFIGVYMIMIILAPAMARLHERFGKSVPVAMVAAAVVVDAASFAFDSEPVGYINFAFVWLFVHQLGFFYADGKLQQLSRLKHLAMAAGGLALMTVLTTFGPYSSSMVGLHNERTNTNPPTIVIMALTIWQVGLAMLARNWVSSKLESRKTWAAVILVNSVIMTTFLWHQTATLIAAGTMYPAGFPQPNPGSARWWLTRPLWVGAMAVLLAVLVTIFGRFERLRSAPRQAEDVEIGRLSRGVLAASGVVILLTGLLGFAVSGFEGFASVDKRDVLVFLSVNPLQNVIHLLIGTMILSAASKGRPRVAVPFSGTLLLLLAAVGSQSASISELLALNPAGHGFHLLAGAVVLCAAFERAPRPAPATS